MKKLIAAIWCLSIFGCGGGSGSTAVVGVDVPDVSGSYSCVANCENDVCIYSETVIVTQNGSHIDLESEFGTWSGTVESDGSFSVSGDLGDCDGIWEGDSSTVHCFSDGESCQVASYQ